MLMNVRRKLAELALARAGDTGAPTRFEVVDIVYYVFLHLISCGTCLPFNAFTSVTVKKKNNNKNTNPTQLNIFIYLNSEF